MKAMFFVTGLLPVRIFRTKSVHLKPAKFLLKSRGNDVIVDINVLTFAEPCNVLCSECKYTGPLRDLTK